MWGDHWACVVKELFPFRQQLSQAWPAQTWILDCGHLTQMTNITDLDGQDTYCTLPPSWKSLKVNGQRLDGVGFIDNSPSTN